MQLKDQGILVQGLVLLMPTYILIKLIVPMFFIHTQFVMPTLFRVEYKTDILSLLELGCLSLMTGKCFISMLEL